MEVITGNTAAILRSGITPFGRQLRDLTTGVKYYDREVLMAGKWCPPLAQNQQHAEPRPGERVVLWCLYDPDANEAKPWRVQWKEGGEKMGTRKGRDDVRVKA